jgi:uncharacterized membrane protein YfcA
VPTFFVLANTQSGTSSLLSFFLEAGLPALTAGVFTGSYLFGKVNSEAYRRALCVLLITLGLVMMVKSVIGDW